MNNIDIWDNISNLENGASFTTHTITLTKRKPLFYSVSFENDYIIINNSNLKAPSVKLKQRRKINKTEFIKVSSYYNKWYEGVFGIRKVVRAVSQNTSYIFGIINHFR